MAASHQPDMPEPPLTIPLDVVCGIVDKLREYDSLNLLDNADEELDEGGNPLDRENVDILQELENQCEFDPLRQELHAYIDELPADQQIDLVALMWLGLDNCSAGDWPSVHEEAVRGHNARTTDYLLGSPQAADFLEEGLATLGLACEAPTNKSA